VKTIALILKCHVPNSELQGEEDAEEVLDEHECGICSRNGWGLVLLGVIPDPKRIDGNDGKGQILEEFGLRYPGCRTDVLIEA